jgi:acyl dehydratase
VSEPPGHEPSGDGPADRTVPAPWRVGPISRTDIVRYQGASGDMHPFHHDDDYAIARGFRGVFSVGMLTAGYLATYAAAWLGESRIRRFRTRFQEQVWPGDVLTISGRWCAPEEAGWTATSSAGRAGDVELLVAVALDCVNQDGRTVAVAHGAFVA